MPKYNLFLDDFRNPEQAFAYTRNTVYLLEEWQTMRSYNDFVDIITNNGLPEIVSFDHDLADEHYNDEMYNGTESYDKLYATFKEKTGMDCVKWLVDYCIDNKKPFPKWFIHSMNPAGKINMESYIENYLKHCENVNG